MLGNPSLQYVYLMLRFQWSLFFCVLSYVPSYKVISESNKAGFRPGNITVDRRYSDFVWLQGEFSREFPGETLSNMIAKLVVIDFETFFTTFRLHSTSFAR